MNDQVRGLDEVTRKEREYINRHKAGLIWLTGLSGAGKSTLANKLSVLLHTQGINNIRLDGDIVRSGLCSDLGFSSQDRHENIRRIAELSKILINSELVVIASFISPRIADRDLLEKIVGARDYFEIFCKCGLESCESRDVKGLYARARKGEIKQFTGIDSPYEEPVNPKLILDTENKTIEECFSALAIYVTNELAL